MKFCQRTARCLWNYSFADGIPLSAYLFWCDFPPKKSKPRRVLLDEFDELAIRFEVNLMMHKLAADYFHNRAFWFTFFPLLVVTSVVSVCGFVKTNEYDDSMVHDGNLTRAFSYSIGEDSKFSVSGEDLPIVVGVLGVLSTFLASLGKHLNYQSKGDMHASAANTLSGIVESVTFERLELQHKLKFEKIETEDSGMTDKTNQNISDLRVNLDKHKAKFDTMEKSCVEPIPNKIKCAYAELRDICSQLPSKYRYKFHIKYANLLFRDFQNRGFAWVCPCYPPSINVTSRYAIIIRCDVEAIVSREFKGDKGYNSFDELQKSVARFEDSSLLPSTGYGNATGTGGTRDSFIGRTEGARKGLFASGSGGGSGVAKKAFRKEDSIRIPGDAGGDGTGGPKNDAENPPETG